MEEFASAETEWDNVREITAQFQQEEETKVIRPPACSPLVTVEEVVEYLKTKTDMDHYLGLVKPPSRRSGVRRLFSCLLGPPSLPPHLRQSVRLVQATALIAFSNEVRPSERGEGYTRVTREEQRGESELYSPKIPFPPAGAGAPGHAEDNLQTADLHHPGLSQVRLTLGGDRLPGLRPQH